VRAQPSKVTNIDKTCLRNWAVPDMDYGFSVSRPHNTCRQRERRKQLYVANLRAEFYETRKAPWDQKRDITYNTGKSALMLLFNPPIREKPSMVRAQHPYLDIRG
jgi:hypothetical protein